MAARTAARVSLESPQFTDVVAEQLPVLAQVMGLRAQTGQEMRVME